MKPTSRLASSSTLQLEGYSVDVAKTGREAGEFLLNAQRYGVIILDVMLPDTDGFTICRRLRGAGFMSR